MRIASRFGAVCASVLLVTLAACGEEQAPATGGQERTVTVTAETVRMRPWSDTLQALGTVKARESVVVTAKVSETVQRVHFDSGDVVRAGAPLVTLSGQAQQAGLAEAQAAANEAQKLYQRQSELAEQQLIARAALDSQRATRDSARARVAQVRAEIGDRTIRAPFPGVLGMRQISPGSLVTPGTAIATLDDIARVYVDFPVPESMLANLAGGQSLTGRSVAYPGRAFDGLVSTIEARIDPATRAVTVRGDFANPDRALRPGMLMQVSLHRPEREALLVPEISIVQVGNSTFVYRIATDGGAERVDVKIGARRDGLAEVTTGLKPGERIVVDGTGKLRPGSKVAVQGADAKPEAAPADAVGGAASE